MITIHFFMRRSQSNHNQMQILLILLLFYSTQWMLVQGFDVLSHYRQYLSSSNNSLISHRNFPSKRIGHTISSRITSTISNYTSDYFDHVSLSQILAIDPIKRTIIVEGGCSMEALIEASIKHTLIPCVVPELKGMTVGGAIVGSALESSSIFYGQFNDIASRIWLRTTHGSIICCHRDQYQAHHVLWCALAGSYGTLGRVLCAEIECISIPSSNAMVEISLHSYHNLSHAISFMKNIASNKNRDKCDFVDGINYPEDSSKRPSSTIIATGKIISSEEISGDIDRYNPDQPWEYWYYEKIQKAAQNPTRKLLIPLRSYLFRYDRGAFWMARPLKFSFQAILRSPLIAPLFLVTHMNFIPRLLCRWFFTTKRLFALLRKAHPQIIRKRMVIMDVYVASDSTEKLVSYVRKNIPISTPLWLCPVKGLRREIHYQPFSPHGIYKNKDELYIDVGIYGRVIDQGGWKYTRLLDEWTFHHPARKMLYSQHTFTRDEFWDESKHGLNRNLYDSLRKAYGVNDNYPNLYDKVVGVGDQIRPLVKYLLSYLFL